MVEETKGNYLVTQVVTLIHMPQAGYKPRQAVRDSGQAVAISKTIQL